MPDTLARHREQYCAARPTAPSADAAFVGRKSAAPSANADGGLPPAFAGVIRPTGSPPQSCGSDPRTFGEGRELGPDDRGCHGVVDKGEGRKAAIGPGDHPLTADDVGVMANPLGDQPRMLDEIGRRIDHPRYEDLVVGNFRAA